MLKDFPYLRKHRFFLIIVQDQWGTMQSKDSLGCQIAINNNFNMKKRP
jgi:hypothetical protein